MRRRICPVCQAETLIINKKGEEACKNCDKNAKLNQRLRNKIKTKNFQRENPIKEIWDYLKTQEKRHAVLQFWYRDDIKPRVISDYYLDEKYINVRSDKGYFIKFLIDKIRKI